MKILSDSADILILFHFLWIVFQILKVRVQHTHYFYFFDLGCNPQLPLGWHKVPCISPEVLQKCYKTLSRHLRSQETGAKKYASLWRPNPAPLQWERWLSQCESGCCGGLERVGEGWNKVIPGQGKGGPVGGPVEDQEGGGARIQYLGQILTPLLRDPVKHQAAPICVISLGGTDPSSHIETAAVWPKLRGISCPCPGLNHSQPQPHTGYRTGQQACWFHHGLGLGCPRSWRTFRIQVECMEWLLKY